MYNMNYKLTRYKIKFQHIKKMEWPSAQKRDENISSKYVNKFISQRPDNSKKKVVVKRWN